MAGNRRRKRIGHSRHGHKPTLETLRLRLEACVEREDDLACWIWTCAGIPGNYGKFRTVGRSEQAHRAAWLLYVGDLEPGVLVLHNCDVRSCVNWLHLQPGYADDNMKHMHARGRSRWGPNRQPAQPWTEQDFRRWGAKITYQRENMMHTAIALQLPDEAHRLVDEAADAAGWLRGTHRSNQLRAAAHSSMDILLTRCRSSIEKAFYGSLLLKSIDGEGLLVVVDHTTAVDILRFRHRVRRLHELREEFAIDQHHGFNDFVGFVDWLGPEADVEFLALYQEVGLQEMPHLTLHLERSDGTRVDGLMFHPLDEWEIVVSCGRLTEVDAVLEKIKNPPL